MTIREWAVDYCVQRGMFEDDAKAVVQKAIEDKANEAMKGRWDHSINDYPKPMLVVLTLSIRHAAVSHIAETCPRAWYKPMFDDAV